MSEPSPIQTRVSSPIPSYQHEEPVPPSPSPGAESIVLTPRLELQESTTVDQSVDVVTCGDRKHEEEDAACESAEPKAKKQKLDGLHQMTSAYNSIGASNQHYTVFPMFSTWQREGTAAVPDGHSPDHIHSPSQQQTQQQIDSILALRSPNEGTAASAGVEVGVPPELRFPEEGLGVATIDATEDDAHARDATIEIDDNHDMLAPPVSEESHAHREAVSFARSPGLRVTHKLAERKRRKEMKELFDELRDELPSERGSKASKWEILNKAIEALKTHKIQQGEMHREIEHLRRELEIARATHPVYHHPPHPGYPAYPMYPGPFPRQIVTHSPHAHAHQQGPHAPGQSHPPVTQSHPQQATQLQVSSAPPSGLQTPTGDPGDVSATGTPASAPTSAQ